MKQFLYRLLATAMALATLLLVDALIAGALPLVAGLFLLPAAVLSAGHFFRLGLQQKRPATVSVAGADVAAAQQKRVA